MPQGYDTQLGSFGTYLSAGQRQRIGLSRALYGNPSFLVLDEPNANLDRLGDEALTSALDGMKQRGQAVVLISHRVQAMGVADTLLYVDRGVQRAFGPQAEVMKLFRQAGPPAKRRIANAADHAGCRIGAGPARRHRAGRRQGLTERTHVEACAGPRCHAGAMAIVRSVGNPRAFARRS